MCTITFIGVTATQTLSGAPARTSTACNGHPDWSPDSRHIAFFSHPEDDSEIFIVNADGTGRTRVTRNHRRDHNPDSAPGGTRLVMDSASPTIPTPRRS